MASTCFLLWNLKLLCCKMNFFHVFLLVMFQMSLLNTYQLMGIGNDTTVNCYIIFIFCWCSCKYFCSTFHPSKLLSICLLVGELVKQNNEGTPQLETLHHYVFHLNKNCIHGSCTEAVRTLHTPNII